MVESSLRSTDPLAFRVNNVSDLDEKIVIAFKQNNQIRLKNLLSQAKYDYDVFICVNHGMHALLLCVPVSGRDPENQLLDELMPDAENKPFEIPNLNVCDTIDLTYEHKQEKMYKIQKVATYFKYVKDDIKTSYYIGKYKGTSPYGLDLAALRASPTMYRVLLDDCIEFAKTFCVELLAHCDNWREIEKEVHERIEKATATGLSVEHLSRRVKSSAFFGNAFLNSLLEGDESTANYRGQLGRAILIFAAAILFFIYPIVIAVIAAKYFNTCT